MDNGFYYVNTFCIFIYFVLHLFKNDCKYYILFAGQTPVTSMFDSPGTWGLSRFITNDEMLKSEAFIHMDEDDIFQVDKADLIQGPTLAELNANDENLLGENTMIFY